MAKKIIEGSLVCMGNRKVKGQGILLKRVKNINEYCDLDISDFWISLYDIKHENYNTNYELSWSMRNEAKNDMLYSIKKSKPEIELAVINEFFAWNTAYSYHCSTGKVMKPKTDFSLVLWYKPPSDYGDRPAFYYKNKQLWHPTNLLKNV